MNRSKLRGIKPDSRIKDIRDKGDIGFEDMLHITVEIEKIMKEKDQFRDTIGKRESFHAAAGGSRRQDRYVLVETLTNACEKAAAALEKKVKFTVDELDGVVLERGPHRIIKEVLTQLVRNSVYHGIEAPAERTDSGKTSTGTIRLSITCEDDQVHIQLSDDGRGLNVDKIREKALELHILQKEDMDDKNHLLQALIDGNRFEALSISLDDTDPYEENFSPIDSEEDVSDYEPAFFETAWKKEILLGSMQQSDLWGHLICAYSPIVNSQGKVVGVIGSGLEASSIIA